MRWDNSGEVRDEFSASENLRFMQCFNFQCCPYTTICRRPLHALLTFTFLADRTARYYDGLLAS